MTMQILAIGDVVGKIGLRYLEKTLPALRKNADFVIVNGENASDVGITPDQAETIFNVGADVITLGNHSFRKREILPYLDECPYILRPANYAPQTPGRGYGLFDSRFGPVAVINLIGRCNMDYGPDNPFLMIDGILEACSETKLIFLDFHAEATSEKLAMGFMLDGRVSAVWGTHTHVPTADARVLPGGTGYITDLGMTGPVNSVIGIRPELSIQKFRGGVYTYYRAAEGPCRLCGVRFSIDPETGLCSGAEQILI